jgi:hypothetical protein
VVVFGGNLTVEGEIDQNLVAIGGVVTLEDTAVVYGDLVAPASVFRRVEGSQVYGQIITDSGTLDIQIPDVPDIPDVPNVPDIPDMPDVPDIPDVTPNPFTVFDQISYTLTPITNVLWAIIRAFAFSTVAIIVVLFVPDHIRRTSEALVSYPVLSGGLGLLSMIIAIPIMLIFTIMIILIPATILVSIVLSLGLFFGWIAVGLEIGRRIADAISREWSTPIQAGVGTFAMTIVIGSISLVLWGFVSFLLIIGICSIGLGAILLTRFGTQDYIPTESGQSQRVAPAIKGEEDTPPEEKSLPEPKPKTKKKSSTKGKSDQEKKS